MRAIVALIIAITALYVVDQEFTDGKYTDAVKVVIGQLRHSAGI